MNIQEAKKIQIIDYLDVKGLKPAKLYPGAAWYLSPMREEAEPSFKIHLAKNIWYDFGTGEGGTLIDLVKILEHCGTREALKCLSSHSFFFHPQSFKKPDVSNKIEILSVRNLSSDALLQYLQTRQIALRFARKYLREVTFKLYDKQFFALAFRNDKGGFELRNRKFKGCTSPKCFTTIPGRNEKSVNLFEGWSDFLSACTFYDKEPVNTTFVLNSLSFLAKVLERLQSDQRINCILDNDPAGRKATEGILARFKNVTDYAPLLYPGHKDFNEMLTQKSNPCKLSH